MRQNNSNPRKVMIIETVPQSNSEKESDSQLIYNQQSESASSEYFDHNEKYKAMFTSDMEQSRLDKKLIQQKRFEQRKYLQNIFYIIIILNIFTILLYCATASLYYWYLLDFSDQIDIKERIWLSFLYVYSDKTGMESFSGAKSKICGKQQKSENQQKCESLLYNFQVIGIICFCCILLGIIFCIFHCIRIYNLAQGEDVGLRGRFIFAINAVLFTTPPLVYLIYVLISHSKLEISQHNFGLSYYACSANMILYVLVMIYYKLVKSRKDEDDIMDQLLFNPSFYRHLYTSPQMI